MKYTIYLALVFFAMLHTGCNDEIGTSTVTYSKAIAEYGDLNAIRSTPLIGSVQAISDPGKIFISDNFLLIGEEKKGIHILDNSDPENPNHIGFLNIPGNKEYFVDEGFIYAESYYDMMKIDINDLANPKLINRVENYFDSKYVGDGSNAVIGFYYETVTEEIGDDQSDIWNQIYNYNEVFYDFNRSVIPHSAVPASFAGSSNNAIGSVNRITRTKDHVYVANSEMLAIFSDDNELEFVSHQYYGNRMETVFPNGDALFIGGTTSVEILDISDPSNPTFLGSFWHATSCDPVYPNGDVAYITLRTGDDNLCPGDVNSLLTLDIKDLRIPSVVDEIEMDSPYGLTVIGNYLFVGQGEFGLNIFDITDRFSPQLVKYDTSLPAYDIIRHPSREDVVLIAGPNGFGQYDVSEDIVFSVLSWIEY